jgi:hypothetical protein
MSLILRRAARKSERSPRLPRKQTFEAKTEHDLDNVRALLANPDIAIAGVANRRGGRAETSSAPGSKHRANHPDRSPKSLYCNNTSELMLTSIR